jgi:predicted metalloendopeptidase
MTISMETIHRLREGINDQLDHLVEKIEHQRETSAMHDDQISLEEYYEKDEDDDTIEKNGNTMHETKINEKSSVKQKSSTKGSPSLVSFAGSISTDKKIED